jgi:predicted nucleic acid-binding Zn ribbon protein
MGWKPLPGRDHEPPAKIADTLDRVLRHLGAPAPSVLTTVFDRWSDLVGAQIAGHTAPVGLDGATLSVRVDDPAWASQLRWLERDLLTRMNALLGGTVVEKLDVRVGEARNRAANRRGNRRNALNNRRNW